MAEIYEILQALPDDAARLRVMRWSFARFGGEEFKRVVPALPPHAAVAAPAGIPAQASVAHYEAAVAEEIPEGEVVDAVVDTEDLAHQISELNDLFPSRPVGVSKLRRV